MIREILEAAGAYGALHAASRLLLQIKTRLERRELFAQIEKERKAGAPILSKRGFGGGFFLPSADEVKAREELLEFIRPTTAQAVNMLVMCRAMKRNVANASGREINLFTDVMLEEIGEMLNDERRLAVNSKDRKEATDGNKEE